MERNPNVVFATGEAKDMEAMLGDHILEPVILANMSLVCDADPGSRAMATPFAMHPTLAKEWQRMAGALAFIMLGAAESLRRELVDQLPDVVQAQTDCVLREVQRLQDLINAHSVDLNDAAEAPE